MTPLAAAAEVGFSTVEVSDEPGAPIEVGLWYPASGVPRPTTIGLSSQMLVPGAAPLGHDLPLVLIAHGSGGDFAGHGDTALALAQAGFVAAAPTFTGDNHRDQSRTLDVAGRARQLERVTDAVLSSWGPHVVDGKRVGAFGFSAGGLTVLILAGGEPDLDMMGPNCAAHSALFDCRLVAGHGGIPLQAGSTAFPHDPRVRAIAVAAPALGFAFNRQRLAHVRLPVQLWGADDDAILPAPLYVEVVRQSLPRQAEFHPVPHGGHFDFLAPCSTGLAKVAPAICTSEAGFDRVRFHRRLNADLVAFFERTL